MNDKTHKEERNHKLVAVTYARVSTEDQATNGLSIEAQEAVCVEHASKGGYSILEKIRDEGRSGGSLKRPGIKRLIELTENGLIGAVFMIHGDRLARNTADHIYIMDFFEKHDIEVHFVYQQGTDRKTAAGYTADTMLAVMSEHFRRVASEKTISSLREKAKEGWFPGVAPIGYLNVDNPNFRNGEMSKRIIVKDPVMGPLVSEAFQLFSTGSYNGMELNDFMYEKGLRTRRGNKVSYGVFYDLLSNPFYTGELHWKDIHLTNAKHEPLINKETFNRVKAILDAHNNKANRRRKYWFLLRGIIYCAEHRGSRYTAEWHTKKSGIKFAYYHCSERHGCRGQYSPKDGLENKVGELFKNLHFSQELVDRIVDKIQNSIKHSEQEHVVNVNRLTAQRNSLIAKKRIAENKLLKEVISDDDFIRIRGEIDTEVGLIDSQLSKLELSRGVDIDTTRTVLNLVRNIGNAYEKASPEIKHQYLTVFFKAIYVYNGEIQEVVYTDLINELMRLKHLLKLKRAKKTAIRGEVIIKPNMGGMRESNPRWQCHKLQCCRYTNASINIAYILT